jgi:PhnB protein
MTNVYLFFDGKCAEAMKFYEKMLKGKLRLMTVKESPMANQPGFGNPDAVLHSRLDFDGGILMASDWMAPDPYPGMKGFRVSIEVKTVNEAKRLFDTLSKSGTVDMPQQKTFWVESFAMLVDRFGTPWMISGGKALQ